MRKHSHLLFGATYLAADGTATGGGTTTGGSSVATGGGSAPTTTGNTMPTPPAGATGATPQAGATEQGSAPATTPGKVEDLPEWAQSMVAELRRENAGHRTKAKEAETAAAAAEEQRLASQQQWQELAESRQARLAELEPKSALADALTERIAARINAEIAEWPEEVKALLPKDAPVLEYEAAVERARPLVAKLTPQTPPAAGNGPRPAPTGTAGQVTQQRQARAAERKFISRTF